jgi:hypothetical protein
MIVGYLKEEADDGIEESSIHVRATILRIGLCVSGCNIQLGEDVPDPKHPM